MARSMPRDRKILALVAAALLVVVGFKLYPPSWTLNSVALPSGPCGNIITLALSNKLQARSCSHPRPLRGAAATSKPLSIAITSPVADVRLRSERRQPWLYPLNNSYSYMFFVGQSDLPGEQAALEQEMMAYGDIVQLNVLDTYENLTIKSVGSAVWWHKWRQAHPDPKAPLWFWLKVEDYMDNSFEDIVASVTAAVEADDGTSARLYTGGSIFGGGQVMRGGRWGCDEQHCPYSTYPTKYAGGQYLLGKDAVAVLNDFGLPKLDLTNPYPIEDHYVANTLKVSGGIDVVRDKRLWWKGPPYNAPYIIDRGGFHFLGQRWPNKA